MAQRSLRATLRAGALGVSPHVDSKRFAVLVASFTIEGSARFALCQTRAGEILQE